jgi:hypothetical protein
VDGACVCVVGGWKVSGGLCALTESAGNYLGSTLGCPTPLLRLLMQWIWQGKGPVPPAPPTGQYREAR